MNNLIKNNSVKNSKNEIKKIHIIHYNKKNKVPKAETKNNSNKIIKEIKILTEQKELSKNSNSKKNINEVKLSIDDNIDDKLKIENKKKISNSCKDLIERLLNENPQKRLRIKDILEHPFIKKYSKKALLYTKKSSTIINEDKINNQLSKNLNDVNNNNIHINKRDELNNMKVNSRLKRSNTININGNNDSKFGLKYFSSKKMLFNDIKEIEEQKAIKNNHKSNKQLALLAKFRYSLNIQLEKAKKSIENISFKSNQNFTFEDIRDNQFQKDMERQKKEKRYKK